MKNQLKLSVGATALLMSVGAHAGVIDLFTTSQAEIEQVAIGSTGSEAGSAGDTSILGGFRGLYLEVTATDFGNPANMSVSSVGTPHLSFSSGSGTTAFGQIQWIGDNTATPTQILSTAPVLPGTATGLSNYDLTMGGTVSAFQVQTLQSDLEWAFDVTLFTDATHWTTVVLKNTPTTSTITEVIPFATFTTAALCGFDDPTAATGVFHIYCGAGGTANTTLLNGLIATIDSNTYVGSTKNVDLTLGLITTVPEPGILGLLGIGLVGLGFVGRAHRKVA